MGISLGTLEKHFASELVDGPRVMRQELLAIVMDTAMTGNKSAIALLERMTRDDGQPRRYRRRASFERSPAPGSVRQAE